MLAPTTAYLRYFASHRQIREALALLEDAIRHDPQCGAALGLGDSAANIWPQTSTPRIVRRGSTLDDGPSSCRGDDPGALADAGAVLGEDIDAMIVLVDRALALNSGYRDRLDHQRLHKALGRANGSRD